MMMTTLAQPSRSNRGCFDVDKRPAVRSRWNPTPEQVMGLEELYRNGLKTPTAQQIRQITTELRNYGKIESKNVFYWFQNHRARERQKRRRQLMSMYQPDFKSQQQQRGGLTNCIVLSNQESASVVQERMRRMVNETSSMQIVEQSDSRRPTSETKASATFSCNEFLKFHYDYGCGMVLSAPNLYKGEGEREEEERRETQTLELFPLKSDNVKCANETKISMSGTTN